MRPYAKLRREVYLSRVWTGDIGMQHWTGIQLSYHRLRAERLLDAD